MALFLGLLCVPLAQAGVPEAAAFLESRVSAQTGAAGEGTGEEVELVTAEALRALRAAGRGFGERAQAAEVYLATAPWPPDTELVLRRHLALRGGTWAADAWAYNLVTVPTAGPGFAEPDALHLALLLQLPPPVTASPFRMGCAASQLMSTGRSLL